MRFLLHPLAAVSFSMLLAPAVSGQQPPERPSVFVDPVNLTGVQEVILNGLNLAAVVADEEVAAGIQKAADVWGLHVDLFVRPSPPERLDLLAELANKGSAALITDTRIERDAKHLLATVEEVNRGKRATLSPLPIISVDDRGDALPLLRVHSAAAEDRFAAGFEAVRRARAQLLPQIPKFDELFNIAFPITPLPDPFFQATKFPYPEPVIRSVRTVSSRSASSHAHTSCHAVAQLGNMIHRTSKADPEIFLLGFEGGNLSLKAQPGAVTKDKLSAVMTSYVIAVRGERGGERRDLLSENDGLPTSAFKPAVHVPEELDQALTAWQKQGMIGGFERVGDDEVVLTGFDGSDRRFRASFFMVSTDVPPKEPELVAGMDGYGRHVLEMTSTQGFVQLLGEVQSGGPIAQLARPPHTENARASLARSYLEAEVEPPQGATPLLSPRHPPRGGMVTQAGGMVGVIGLPLGALLQKVDDTAPRFQPYILAFEGGFLAVTPEEPLTERQVEAAVSRIDIDERGSLGSDQTIQITLAGGDRIVFRRTVLNFGETDIALGDLQRMALTSGWEYVGARGQGLGANVVLHNLLGKHRKFMSSLNVWPSRARPDRPHVSWYVDGMQRLNFTVVSPQGWRQEFVEVPLRVPPIPRDVELFAGVSRLD